MFGWLVGYYRHVMDPNWRYLLISSEVANAAPPVSERGLVGYRGGLTRVSCVKYHERRTFHAQGKLLQLFVFNGFHTRWLNLRQAAYSAVVDVSWVAAVGNVQTRPRKETGTRGEGFDQRWPRNESPPIAVPVHERTGVCIILAGCLVWSQARLEQAGHENLSAFTHETFVVSGLLRENNQEGGFDETSCEADRAHTNTYCRPSRNYTHTHTPSTFTMSIGLAKQIITETIPHDVCINYTEACDK